MTHKFHRSPAIEFAMRDLHVTGQAVQCMTHQFHRAPAIEFELTVLQK
jgi:hypothetical protein